MQAFAVRAAGVEAQRCTQARPQAGSTLYRPQATYRLGLTVVSFTHALLLQNGAGRRKSSSEPTWVSGQ